MSLPLAQLSDAIVSTLIQSGSLGVVVLWFMLRHEKKVEAMTEALNHLIRMTAIEVLSRPGLMQRTKEEVEELLTALELRKKG